MYYFLKLIFLVIRLTSGNFLVNPVMTRTHYELVISKRRYTRVDMVFEMLRIVAIAADTTEYQGIRYVDIPKTYTGLHIRNALQEFEEIIYSSAGTNMNHSKLDSIKDHIYRTYLGIRK